MQRRTGVMPVSGRDETAFDVDHDPGVEPDVPLSDEALLDLLDALVEERGRVPAARALGVNYRTLVNCCNSRRVSRRMRQALGEFRDAQDAGDVGSGIVAGDVRGEDAEETREDRSAELEEENRELRDTVQAQAEELAALRRKVAELEEEGQELAEAAAVDGVQGQPGDWRPPRRRPGMPDAGVVTLEEQPDEEHALGPAAPLVAEWRMIRAGVGDRSAGSRVDRALAAVRRWELEAEMLRSFFLTLPPETAPLDESRRKDHVRWREEALAEARRELGRAKRARLLKKVLTLGLWRG